MKLLALGKSRFYYRTKPFLSRKRQKRRKQTTVSLQQSPAGAGSGVGSYSCYIIVFMFLKHLVQINSLSSLSYRIKRRDLSSHHLSSSWCRRVMSSSCANSFLLLHWFVGQLRSLDQSFDEDFFSLIGESIISIIVECILPTIKPWWFCIVSVFPWLVSHGGFFHPENSLEGLQVLWNKKRNLKPPWAWRRLCTSCYFDILTWTMVTPLIQKGVFHLYLTTRGNTACLCDMEWETTELSAYHCQFEGLFMIWIETTTNHVISRSGGVWNGQ
ncbi:hypothetical protein YC2023_013349 [Brassica napus]